MENFHFKNLQILLGLNLKKSQYQYTLPINLFVSIVWNITNVNAVNQTQYNDHLVFHVINHPVVVMNVRFA